MVLCGALHTIFFSRVCPISLKERTNMLNHYENICNITLTQTAMRLKSMNGKRTQSTTIAHVQPCHYLVVWNMAGAAYVERMLRLFTVLLISIRYSFGASTGLKGGWACLKWKKAHSCPEIECMKGRREKTKTNKSFRIMHDAEV